MAAFLLNTSKGDKIDAAREILDDNIRYRDMIMADELLRELADRDKN